MACLIEAIFSPWKPNPAYQLQLQADRSFRFDLCRGACIPLREENVLPVFWLEDSTRGTLR